MSLREQYNARGVYVFVMTPFKTTTNRKGQYEVDLVGVEKNIAHFASIPGDKAMVLCGGSGEFADLSPTEVRDIAYAAVSGADGRCQIVSGIGHADNTAVKMAQAAQEAGCDAVLVMPHDPVVKRGDTAIYQRHHNIAKAIDIGMIPFRAPKQTLSIDLVCRFAKMDRVVGIKEESGAVDWVRTGCHITKNAVPFITGGGENMVPYYYLAGAVGFTTGMANLTLKQSIALHHAAIHGKWNQTMSLRDYFEPLNERRRTMGSAMLKAGLEMMGLSGGPVRATGKRLNASERHSVRRLLKVHKIL
jgi:dihydrodipicolinate synthase/N-acetylneuraminate lyase